MTLSDSSVVTLGLPAILREFDASVSAVAWVLIAFNLALALAAVGGAWLVRGHGRVAYVIAVGGFAAASLTCAAAPSLELLLRRLERRRAIGLWAAAGVLGGAVGRPPAAS